jgi:hypothetical protein
VADGNVGRLKDKPYTRGTFYGLVEAARSNSFEILKWFMRDDIVHICYLSISGFYAAQESGDGR